MLPKPALEREAAAGARGDDQIHEDHDGVVAPAVGIMFSPEAYVPSEDFFLYGPKHYEN